jgi:hypothetical protein
LLGTRQAEKLIAQPNSANHQVDLRLVAVVEIQVGRQLDGPRSSVGSTLIWSGRTGWCWG